MNDKVSKISIVGAGMVATPGVTYKMFRSLAEEKINFALNFLDHYMGQHIKKR